MKDLTPINPGPILSSLNTCLTRLHSFLWLFTIFVPDPNEEGHPLAILPFSIHPDCLF
jgi:hypothetical protein